MQYSKEQIEKVQELAEALTPIRDIATLLDVPEDELRIDIRNHNSEVSRAYRIAKAEIALRLRKQEIELANVGSPLAVSITNQYIVSMSSDEDL